MKKRGANMDGIIDEILKIDEQRREIIGSSEEKKAEQNRVSKEMPQLKKSGADVSEIMEQMKSLSAQVKELSAKLSELESAQADLIMGIPNIPQDSVPIGKDDSDNVEVRKIGDPTSFDFKPLAHWDIGANLGILDSERAAKVTGATFHIYKGLGARLERAVINFYLDNHTDNGYTEVFPPFMVNRASMTGTGQLPKFEEDAFHLENFDYFLIPTAEVPVTNMHRNEILTADERIPRVL